MKRFAKNTGFLTLLMAVTVIFALATVIYVDAARYKDHRHSVKSTATGFASQIKYSVDHALSATYTLAAFVRRHGGSVVEFDHLASQMIQYYPGAAAMQLSPQGIIRHTYPLAGNEQAIGYDVLQDPAINRSAFDAIDQKRLTLSQPVNLVQGGLATAGRLPIFLQDHSGAEQFWGFSHVLIRFPDVLHSTELEKLSELGIAYRLISKDPAGSEILLAKSDDPVVDNPLYIPIRIQDKEWILEVSPVDGWRNGYWLLLDIAAGLSFCLLIFTSVLLLKKLRHDQVSLEKAVAERTQTLENTLIHTELAMRTARQSWFEVDLENGSIMVGDEYPALLDYTPEEFTSSLENLLENIHPEDRGMMDNIIQRCLESGDSAEVEFRRMTRTGYWLWLHAIAKGVHDEKTGAVTRIIGVVTDISRRKQNEVLEEARLRVLEQLVRNASLEEIFASIVNMVEDTSRGAICSILLLDKEKKHLHLGHAPNLPEFYNDAIEGIEIGDGVGSCGTAAFKRERVIVEDIHNHPYWAPYTALAAEAGLASCWSEPIMGADDDILGTFAIYHRRPCAPSQRDIEVISFAARLVMLAIEKTRTDERLTLFSRVFDDAEEGIMVTDLQPRIVDVNPKFCEITGFSREDALNKNPSLLSSGKQDPMFYKTLWQSLQEKGVWRGEIWNRRKDGSLYIEQLTISGITNAAGERTHYVGIFSDITQLKSQQQALEMMAYHDVLTQLPNRVLLTDRFQQATARCNRTGSLLAICFLDLDNFKQVNDTYGHNVGDQLLIQVSARILSCIREEDTASRLGGDEFAILIGDVNSTEDCKDALSRIHSSIAQPYVIEGHEIHITASSGITIYPHDQVDIDTLLRHADQAMYRVKLDGKNDFHLFNAQNDQQLIETHNKRRDIEHALRDGQFELHYQPKINMRTGEVWGAEALIRWNHPEKGLLSPHHFLTAVASTNLDVAIGNWVIKQAIRQLSIWHNAGLKLEVSINISAFHLLSPDFETELTVRLGEYPEVDTRYVQLEILESTDFGNLQAINKVIEQCQNNLGVSFALDDFGTGFSSLAHMRNLMADNIKIDCSFVTHLMNSPDDYRIVDGVIGMAEAFDRNIIAEGVETVWEGQMLMLMGCENAQGYAISRPMPAENIIEWVTCYRPFEQWQRFDSRHLSDHDVMKHLFILSLDYWTHSLEKAVSAAPDSDAQWPVSDQDHWHWYAWSERCHKDQLLDERALKQIDANRELLHQDAYKMELRYKSGDIEGARADLPVLKQHVSEAREHLVSL